MPASPTSASNWLTRLRRKEIFSSIPGRSIAQKFRAVFKKYRYSPLAGDEVLLKNFEPFLKNSTSNIGMSCQLIDVYAIYDCFLLSKFQETDWPHFVIRVVFSSWSF